MDTFEANKEGHYERLWRDECEAGVVVRRERDDAQWSARHWKQVATYMADIYAAHAQAALMRKATSKSQRASHALVCKRLLAMLEGAEQPPNLARYRDDGAAAYVLMRLRDVIEEVG